MIRSDSELAKLAHSWSEMV